MHKTLLQNSRAITHERPLCFADPLILSPTAKAFIMKDLIPLLKGKTLDVNGTHLLAAWTDPSAAPLGPDNKPWSNPRDLLANQEKTADSLRGFFTSWQYDMAWTAFNEQNEPRMAKVDAFADSLFLYGAVELSNFAKYGLDPNYSAAAFGRALTHRRNTTRILMGATEGMLVQNASLIAKLLSDFVH